jgi:hypothetical protein
MQGTGHASSPFFSIWYVHLGIYTRQVCTSLTAAASSSSQQPSAKATHKGSCGKLAVDEGFKVVASLAQLRDGGAAPAWKRPNPKQRKKLKQARL